MSYSRFTNWDAYIYSTGSLNGEYISCLGCRLGEGDDILVSTPGSRFSMSETDDLYIKEFRAYSTNAILEHIKRHREAGHNLPDGIEENIQRDDKRNFPA